MTKVELEALCDHYDLGRAVSVERLGGTRNENLRLQTDRGVWFVRQRYRGYSDPARIAFDHHAISYLSEKGARAVAPRAGVDGQSFWLENGKVWEVFPSIAGRHLHDADESDVRLLGDALTTLHIAGRSFTDRYDKLGARGETDPAGLTAITRQVAAQSSDARAVAERYERWIIDAARQLNDQAFAALPHTLIHGDIQPANILVNGIQIAAFVDFDWCAWRPRAYDLAFAILLCCATHESPLRGEDIWSLSQPARIVPKLVNIFLDACAGAGWPLEETELKALRPQIALSWCSVRLAGLSKVAPARWMEFLARPPHDLTELIPATLG